MNYAQSVVLVKTFIEPEAVKEFRKSIPKGILSGYSAEKQMQLASIFDNCLSVHVTDAVAMIPAITSVNTTAVLHHANKLFNFGSTFHKDLEDQLNEVNRKLLATKTANMVEVPIEGKHMIPFIVSGNDDQVVYEAVRTMAKSMQLEYFKPCLVFHYGFKVEQAESIYAMFNKDAS